VPDPDLVIVPLRTGATTEPRSAARNTVMIIPMVSPPSVPTSVRSCGGPVTLAPRW
jgi:hypothetical protein